MTDAPTCDRCGERIHDTAYVCGRCADWLRADLEVVAKVAGEAIVTIARQDHIERSGRGEHVEEDTSCGCPQCTSEEEPESALYPTPWPVNLGAAAQHDAAVGELTTWVRHIVETRGIPLGAERAGSDHPLAIMATWLTGQHLDWLRHRPEAAEGFRALSDACRTIVGVVDRPPERWYAGRCQAQLDDGECGEDLYPHAGATTIRCRCGTEHDLEVRKRWLLERAEEVWAPAAWLAHALTQLDVPCTAAAIRGYAFRGRLAPHPEPDAMGNPRYRLGSARELVQEQHRAERERTLRAAVRTAELAERRAARGKVVALEIANGTVATDPVCPEAVR